MLRIQSLFIIVLGLLAAGCVPDRVTWSPDGTKGAIISDEGLAVCDPTGHVSGVWVHDAHGVAWTPDSKKMVIAHDVDLRTLAQLSAAFPKQAESAKSHAPAVKQALLHAGTANDVMNLQSKLSLEADDVNLTIIYLRDTDGPAFALVPTEVWKQMAATTIDAGVVQIYDYAQADAMPRAGAEGRLAYYLSPHAFMELRVSPNGKAVAITKGRFHDAEKTDGCDVIVVGTDGQKMLTIPQCAFPDWTLNGQQLIYVRQSGIAGTSHLGTVAFRNIVNAKGVVFADDNSYAEQVLGIMPYRAASRVRVAKGGIIYFVGLQMNMPALDDGANSRQTLFWIDPKAPTKFQIVTHKSEQALFDAGDTLAFFEPSPDGRKLTIPYKDGRVKVLDVVTGTTIDIQPTPMAAGDGLGLAMEPQWRTADELTFLRPRADGKGNEVVSYSISKKTTTTVSTRWTDGVRDWLGEPK